MSDHQPIFAVPIKLTPDQLHVLRHALGIGEAGTGRQYRNHFVTGAGTADHSLCTGLVEAEMMARHAGNALSGGDDVFTVTERGRAAAVAEAEPVPRGRQRYLAFLQSDTDLPFIDWLRAHDRSSTDDH